jgi:RimJ/RimL family protein N-acetyltransferase
MNAILQTERLSLRKFTLDDAEFIIELTNSASWLRFIGDRNTKTIESAKAYIERVGLKNYDSIGYGLFLVELTDNKTPIGLCGFMNRNTLPSPDIAFAYLPQFEGKGYAYEMATALMDYAKNQLNFTDLIAIVVPENARSINLIEKLGMKFVKEFRFEGDDEDLFLYKFTF